jgi:hypothetical protein
MLALSTTAAAAAAALFYATAVGQQALVDRWERAAFAVGRPLADAEYASLVDLSRYAALYGVATAVVSVAGVSLATAVAGYAFLRRRRPNAEFRRVLAIVAHTSVILALRLVVGAPAGYVRETAASVTSLGNWVPIFNQASAAARVFDTLDLALLWWAAATGAGMASLYGLPSRKGAGTLVGAYVGVVLLLAGVVTALGPG